MKDTTWSFSVLNLKLELIKNTKPTHTHTHVWMADFVRTFYMNVFSILGALMKPESEPKLSSKPETGFWKKLKRIKK